MTDTITPAPKAFFKSKTVVANLIVAIGGVVAIFHPGTQAWIASHAEGILMGVGALNMTLRSVTHGKIAFVDDTAAEGLWRGEDGRFEDTIPELTQLMPDIIIPMI